MPIAISCASCRFTTNAEERLAGKRVRCPKCREPIAIPVMVSAGAAAAPKKSPAASGGPLKSGARPAAPTPPAKAAARSVAPPRLPASTDEPIVVSCRCGAKFKTKAEWAGRTTKCPKCAQPITIPKPAPSEPEATFELEMSAPKAAPAESAAAEQEAAFEPAPVAKSPAKQSAKKEAADDPLFLGDGWIDITEPYAAEDDSVAPAVATASNSAGSDASDGWGEKALAEHDLPDALTEKIQKSLTRGERILHCVRPDPDILRRQAFGAFIGGICLTIPAVLGLGFCIVFAIMGTFKSGLGSMEAWLPLVFGVAIGSMLGIPGVYLATMRGRVVRAMPRRACFLITNRRLIVSHGVGSQPQLGNYGQGYRSTNTESYSGQDLMRVMRQEFKKGDGSGEIHVGRDILDDPGGSNLWALKDAVDLERKIRELLIDPFIDRVLRGEIAMKSGYGRKRNDGNQELPVEGNLKDAFGKPGSLATDDNVKKAKAAVQQDLSKIDPELRKRVETELTRGERVVWIGEPEGKTKGRGMLGAMLGSAKRVEPDYELYAITNRRVLLFDVKGTKVGTGVHEIKVGGRSKRGPVCYYAPDVMDVGMESDDRFEGGGAILFRIVKVTIKARNAGGSNTLSLARNKVETHCFGILRISNFKNVARILFETLGRPIKRA
jgi:hypothetical protein